MFLALITLLRPHQYIKNLFVFAPLMFLFDVGMVEQKGSSVLLAFVLFSLIASSIYILNDMMDIKEDQSHPQKRFRPLASGAVSKKAAWVMFVSLFLGVLLAAYWYSFGLFVVLSIYFLLNVFYSLGLKHVSIIDIFIIATGFVLRLYAGSEVANISLSHWIVIVTFLLALFLALAKRRDDVLLCIEGRETRKSIDGYNLEFVNATMVLMAGVIMVSYILYTVSADVVARFHTVHLYITSVFVVLGIVRYMQITFVEEQSGSPTKIVLKDRFLQCVILGWILSFYLIVKVL